MAFKASDNPGFERELLPAGIHMAICNIICDVGEVKSRQFDKIQHKGYIRWQIPAIRVEREDRSTNTTYEEAAGIGMFFTVSLNEKANLRAMLESWRGRGFTQAELEGFDLFNVLGACCQLNIIHQPDKKKPGAFIDKISGVFGYPRSAPKPVLEGPLLKWSPEDPEQFDELPGWLKAQIKQNMPNLQNPSLPPGEDPFNPANRAGMQFADDDPNSPNYVARSAKLMPAARPAVPAAPRSLQHAMNGAERESPPIDAYDSGPIGHSDFDDEDSDIPF